MTREDLRRAWLPAAAAAAGITSAIVIYTVVVEALHARGYAAPLPGGPLKYAFYVLAAAAFPVLKLAGSRLGGRKATAEETARSLAILAMVKAAAAELPAIAGLILFLLTGLRADFYVLAVTALALEIYHFPRFAAWEERLRGDFGQL